MGFAIDMPSLLRAVGGLGALHRLQGSTLLQQAWLEWAEGHYDAWKAFPGLTQHFFTEGSPDKLNRFMRTQAGIDYDAFSDPAPGYEALAVSNGYALKLAHGASATMTVDSKRYAATTLSPDAVRAYWLPGDEVMFCVVVQDEAGMQYDAWLIPLDQPPADAFTAFFQAQESVTAPLTPLEESMSITVPRIRQRFLTSLDGLYGLSCLGQRTFDQVVQMVDLSLYGSTEAEEWADDLPPVALQWPFVLALTPSSMPEAILMAAYITPEVWVPHQS